MTDVDEQILQLEEDNHYLQLKNKYIQSVGTIFRQKIAFILKELLHDRSDANKLEDVLQGMLDDMNTVEVELPLRSESPATQTAENEATLHASDRADYWRDQFLAIMRDSKPSNMQDAQVLCQILQEKNDLRVREAKLKRELTMLQERYDSLEHSFESALNDKAVTADDCVKELYRRKEEELENKLGLGLNAKEQIEELHQQNKKLEQRNKVLGMRLEKLRKSTDTASAENALTEAREKIMELTRQLQDGGSAVALHDAELRRAQTDIIHMEKNIQLRDNSISRLNAKIEAMEVELQCAFKEGAANADTKENMFLRRQHATFELHTRQLEAEAKELHIKIEEMEGETVKKDGEIAHLNQCLAVKDTLLEDYSAQLKAAELGDEFRGTHANMIEDFASRMKESVSNIEKQISVSDLVQKVGVANQQMERIDSLNKTVTEQKNEIEWFNTVVRTMKAEIQRCIKYKSVPNVEMMDMALRKVQFKLTSQQYPREVIVRAEQGWKEVRDAVSGRTLFYTEDISKTPWKPPPRPKTPPKTKETPRPREPSPKVEVKKEAPQPVVLTPDPAPTESKPVEAANDATDKPPESQLAAESQPTEDGANQEGKEGSPDELEIPQVASPPKGDNWWDGDEDL